MVLIWNNLNATFSGIIEKYVTKFHSNFVYACVCENVCMYQNVYIYICQCALCVSVCVHAESEKKVRSWLCNSYNDTHMNIFSIRVRNKIIDCSIFKITMYIYNFANESWPMPRFLIWKTIQKTAMYNCIADYGHLKTCGRWRKEIRV